MSEDTKYFLAAINFDKDGYKCYKGSPRPVSQQEVEAMFGYSCAVSKLEETNDFSQTELAFFGLTFYTKSVLLIEKKGDSYDENVRLVL